MNNLVLNSFLYLIMSIILSNTAVAGLAGSCGSSISEAIEIPEYICFGEDNIVPYAACAVGRPF